MAKHALLTKRSEKLVATLATSGLLATGIAVPLAQVASATTNSQKVGNTCTVTSDGSSQTALRSAIDNAIADTQCEVVEINNIENSPLTLRISGTALRVGAADVSGDTSRSLTIKSTTGLSVRTETNSTNVSLFQLEDNSFETVTIEGLTFRDSAGSAIDAKDFNGFGGTRTTLRVSNSRFIANGTVTFPDGAIETSSDVEITNSIFSRNYGQAVWTDGDAYISGSLFLENFSPYSDPAEYGGAVRANDIYSVNSTYIDNFSWDGGALYADDDIELALNTFSGNGRSGSESASAFASDSFYMWGNIFVGEGVGEISGAGYDYGYNISELAQANFNSPNSRFASLDELKFGTAPTSLDVDRSTPVTTAPVLPLTRGSVAADFVKGEFPIEAFSSFFAGKTSRDQLGTNRRSGAIDAGAHELRARGGGIVSAPVVVQSEPKRITVPGFAPNSTKLTRPMRAEIRKFLRAYPDLNNVVCRGFTSAPATVRDRALARNRGKVTCDYIKTLRPEATVTIRSGSHTNKPGKQIRRVSITLR